MRGWRRVGTWGQVGGWVTERGVSPPPFPTQGVPASKSSFNDSYHPKSRVRMRGPVGGNLSMTGGGGLSRMNPRGRER